MWPARHRLMTGCLVPAAAIDHTACCQRQETMHRVDNRLHTVYLVMHRWTSNSTSPPCELRPEAPNLAAAPMAPPTVRTSWRTDRRLVPPSPGSAHTRSGDPIPTTMMAKSGARVPRHVLNVRVDTLRPDTNTGERKEREGKGREHGASLAHPPWMREVDR